MRRHPERPLHRFSEPGSLRKEERILGPQEGATQVEHARSITAIRTATPRRT